MGFGAALPSWRAGSFSTAGAQFDRARKMIIPALSLGLEQRSRVLHALHPLYLQIHICIYTYIYIYLSICLSVYLSMCLDADEVWSLSF